MKSLFALNGVVIGHGTSNTSEAVVSSNTAGTTTYEVDDFNPADVGWTVTVDVNGVPTFTEPAATLADLTSMQFMQAWSIAEWNALRTSSTDANAQYVWSIYQLAAQTGTSINMNSKKLAAALAALVPGILASTDRVAEVLAGVVQ